MRTIESALWVWITAFGVMLVTGLPASSAADYCSSSCPESGFHEITIRNLFGQVQPLTGADTYTLGTNSQGLLVACSGSGGLYFLYDEDVGDYLYSGLEADSAICWDNGNDTITVLRSNETMCGLNPMYPFAYGGNTLMMHGEGQDDHLSGGIGRDKLCGGAGNDHLYGYDGNDVLDGLAGDDTMSGGRHVDQLWGYDGLDCLRDNRNSAGDQMSGEGGADHCVTDYPFSSGDSVSCGGQGTTMNTSSQASACTTYEDGNCGFGQCYWED